MRFEAIEINENSKYSFIIGTISKPDDDLKERIRAQIGEAMEALGRPRDSYSVSILQDEEPEEARDSGYPELDLSRDYLLFAMLRSSDSAESLSEREIEERKEELARGIFSPPGSRIALVLLYDSSLGIVITKMPIPALISSYTNPPMGRREK